jgi:hypothetical protein
MDVLTDWCLSGKKLKGGCNYSEGWKKAGKTEEKLAGQCERVDGPENSRPPLDNQRQTVLEKDQLVL